MQRETGSIGIGSFTVSVRRGSFAVFAAQDDS